MAYLAAGAVRLWLTLQQVQSGCSLPCCRYSLAVAYLAAGAVRLWLTLQQVRSGCSLPCSRCSLAVARICRTGAACTVEQDNLIRCIQKGGKSRDPIPLSCFTVVLVTWEKEAAVLTDLICAAFRPEVSCHLMLNLLFLIDEKMLVFLVVKQGCYYVCVLYMLCILYEMYSYRVASSHFCAQLI